MERSKVSPEKKSGNSTPKIRDVPEHSSSTGVNRPVPPPASWGAPIPIENKSGENPGTPARADGPVQGMWRVPPIRTRVAGLASATATSLFSSNSDSPMAAPAGGDAAADSSGSAMASAMTGRSVGDAGVDSAMRVNPEVMERARTDSLAHAFNLLVAHLSHEVPLNRADLDNVHNHLHQYLRPGEGEVFFRELAKAVQARAEKGPDRIHEDEEPEEEPRGEEEGLPRSAHDAHSAGRSPGGMLTAMLRHAGPGTGMPFPGGPGHSGLFRATPLRLAPHKPSSATKDTAVPARITPRQIDDYARAVNSNKPWSWAGDITGGKNLSAKQRKEIKTRARSQIKDVGEVRYKKDKKGKKTKFADFSKVSPIAFKLPKKLWKSSDKVQFQWLDQKLKAWNEEQKKKRDALPDGIKQQHVDQYADALNKPKHKLDWAKDVKDGGKLTSSQKDQIKRIAVLQDKLSGPLPPGVTQKHIDNYARAYNTKGPGRWSWAGDVAGGKKLTDLQKLHIRAKARAQKKLNEPEIKREGHVWHHVEGKGKKGGMMQLVPMGLHNYYPHDGGRSDGQWSSKGKRK